MTCLFSVAGAEGLSPLRVPGTRTCGAWIRPRVQVPFGFRKNKKTDAIASVFLVAGAEGLEPSARGFGDRCSTN